MPRTRSPAQYQIMVNARSHKSVRTAIDASTPVAFPTDSHAAVTAEVAADAMIEAGEGRPGRASDAVAALAQIPPFRVGRVTYRVIAERVAYCQRDFDEVTGAFTDVSRREIALVCRTRPSTLFQHPASCACHICAYVAARGLDTWGRTSRDVWYHNASDTWHVRVEHGTFHQLPRDVAQQARAWARVQPRAERWSGANFKTDDGRIY